MYIAYKYKTQETKRVKEQDKYIDLIKNLIRRILSAYHESGNTTDEYYQNIILPDLTRKEYQFLKQFSAEDL